MVNPSLNKLKIILGTSFGSGYLPVAPGTWGSLVAIPVIWVINLYVGWIGLLAFIIVTSLITLWVTPACEEQWGKDPSKLVMDEWAGQGLSLFMIPLPYTLNEHWWILLAAFILFRFFDILKPFGIKRVQSLEAGLGVLLDDLLAGLYALISLNLLILIVENV